MRERASELVALLEKTEDPKERHALANEVVPVLVAYWDVHPHSAMEMLEYTTFRLELSIAHAVVRSVVQEWKKKPTYDPTAGGSADHCYMSALILSENYDLADQPWGQEMLFETLGKELHYSRFERMRDSQKREEIVRGIARDVGFVPDAKPRHW